MCESEVVDMHNAGMSISMIRRRLGTSHRKVSSLLKACGIEMGKTSGKPVDEESVVLSYAEGNSYDSISKSLGISHKRVNRILLRNRAVPRTLSEATHARFRDDHEFPAWLVEVLHGELLGDGHLEIGRALVVRQAHFSYTTSRESYAMWLSSLFRDAGVGTTPLAHVVGRRKNGGTKDGYIFSTHSSTRLLEEQGRWYANKVKHVPRDLRLTPTVVRHWWMGDGTMCTKHKFGRFCTNDFCFEDVKWLSEQLSLNAGIECWPQLSSRMKNQYNIYVPRRSMDTLLDYMGECPIECFSYKWSRVF